ncbi:hypothetical protein JOF41_000525 [Saccharothrix coeruleofusca]|uniref:hypothetical protein n=1 Tax=Saccharothrix coeruleofusca TaxID=33919 RepID=UPI001AE92AA7|nr:hypothetical protein [Saccharothrix coeruleofusca]MBP2334347.1 hypothetical protein [Saccharothrix coeruleofusca]
MDQPGVGSRVLIAIIGLVVAGLCVAVVLATLAVLDDTDDRSSPFTAALRAPTSQMVRIAELAERVVAPSPIGARNRVPTSTGGHLRHSAR